MRRRTLKDDIYYRIASKRALAASRSSRKFNPNKPAHAVRVLGRQKIIAPPIISFFAHKDYKAFFDFIRTLKMAAAKSKVVIDLSQVSEVKAAAMLIFYAVVERLQIRYGKSHVKTIDCKTQFISAIFYRFGFWSLTQESRSRRNFKISGNLEICSTSYKDKEAGDTSQLRRVIEYVQNSILESGMNGEEGVKAFAAITESCSNVWQHAYDDAFYSDPPSDDDKNWWVAVEKIGTQLFIAVYDSGVGIPVTLSKKPWYGELIAELLTKLGWSGANDGLAIRAAVEYGNSRFKKGGRGKGLAEAKDFVAANPDGTMLIYSGSGSYEFKAGKPELLELLPSPMMGTLIQWNLKLGSSS
ncbi:hypothetical protein [Metapseudomonas otitidis]|uniref:hypothetical protein n=1 Tax=Metapseudomonas otitidis TaxID=319939 RepID=UPI000ADEC04F|nr:hypothetical protein [Pseudomonas otitidis]